MTRTLHLIVSGASTTPEETVPDLAHLLQDRGWQVRVLSTPMGLRFHDPEPLAEITGQPVTSTYRMPGTGRRLEPADAVLACPLSFNSLNKTVLGLTDTFAVGALCEMIGLGVPTVVVPKASPGLKGHASWERSLAALAEYPAVTLLQDDERKLPRWPLVANTLSQAFSAT